MKYKTISLTIISMISLLGACDANDTHTEVPCNQIMLNY